MVNTVIRLCWRLSDREDETRGFQLNAIYAFGVARTINTNEWSISKILFTVGAYMSAFSM